MYNLHLSRLELSICNQLHINTVNYDLSDKAHYILDQLSTYKRIVKHLNIIDMLKQLYIYDSRLHYALTYTDVKTYVL